MNILQMQTIVTVIVTLAQHVLKCLPKETLHYAFQPSLNTD